MDSAKLILADPVSLPMQLDRLSSIDTATEAKKKDFAKKFESIFIEKLMNEMKKTIGDWGMDKTEGEKQINGIFWLYLARNVSQNGGIGMWKDIYNQMNSMEQKNPQAESIDKKL